MAQSPADKTSEMRPSKFVENPVDRKLQRHDDKL